MPDHLHLFVTLPDEIGLSNWMKSLKNSLSKALRTFFDHVLRSGQAYESKWEYIRHNPVEEGFVSAPEDWSFQGELHALRYD